jgi:Fe(3+) dicitrate transport protein
VLQDYEIRTGTAYAAFVQNRFSVTDRLHVVPGLRLEYFSYQRNILRTRVRRVNPETGTATRLPEDVDIRSSDNLLELIPGLGVTWNADERLTLFAGAHRGFSPPRVKDALIYEAAAANGRIGLIAAYSTWNMAASYRLPVSGMTVFGTVKNLTDATYIASRRPEGIKPGVPRLVQAGVRMGF